MPVDLNCTIVHARDPQASAVLQAGILGRPTPGPFAHFDTVALENGVTLDFLATDELVLVEHSAFLMSETEFDQLLDRLVEQGFPHWADLGRRHPGIKRFFRPRDGLGLSRRTAECRIRKGGASLRSRSCAKTLRPNRSGPRPPRLHRLCTR